MTSMTILSKKGAAASAADAGKGGLGGPAGSFEDMEMVRTASRVTRDLHSPNPVIYWCDLIISTIIGYAAMFLAVTGTGWIMPVLTGIISVLALYRAGSFIHEITHIRHASMPYYRFAFNAFIGVPLLVPSFMYEGIHNLHHARTRYGTAEDPEYLPLALMKPYSVPVFVLLSSLAPIALLIRFAILAPVSAVVPPLRRFVVQRYSGLVINPDFRRKPAEGDARKQWIVQEIAASLWAITLLGLVISGVLALKSFAIILLIASATIVFNQVRTLVAHLWENDGDVMTVSEQYLDSVNVPPPSPFAAIWAPVGLRYHAIHHLLPGVPYHNLAEAHRRVADALSGDTTYHRASYRGLFGLVRRLIGRTFGKTAG